MCFVNEPDWYASINEWTEYLAEKETRCDECHCRIQPGELVHHLFQQEHEECHACENCECECPDVDDFCHECKCEKPNFGEDFTYDRCDGCHKFLEAIEESEIEAGCKSWEARPHLCGMLEEIREGDNDDHREAKRYWKKAREMFPELMESGYLKRIWKQLV